MLTLPLSALTALTEPLIVLSRVGPTNALYGTLKATENASRQAFRSFFPKIPLSRSEEAAKSIKDSMTEQQEGRKKDWSEAITTSAYANLGYDEEKGTFDKDDAPADTSQQEMGQGEQGETFEDPSAIKNTSDASKQAMNRQSMLEQGNVNEEDFNMFLQNKAQTQEGFNPNNWSESDLQEYLSMVGG